MDNMTSKTLLPLHRRMLLEMGENIKMARLRRRLTTTQVAERANITRTTLYAIERGAETVSMGAYFSVLVALRLEHDILLLAKDDEFGRKLQDAELVVKKRAPKRKAEHEGK
ncbi:helix-turn-helix protein [Breznakibacter xylanolyticus]|uniref:Helix-turn-helix protein n=2 Tax=Breznakibacter xylanolyticus TaxID=990 RepID=A0A2W7MVZ7_9BACT|nr:helix-turn-helix protein [Breznakibacter xylanolyticus]